MGFKERLGKELLFFDGAMGTMLQNQGLQSGELPELWNISEEAVIAEIHTRYLEAGCDIVKANTFGANPFKMKGTGYTCGEVVKKGVEIAKRAIAESGRKAYAALDIGSLGKLLEPLGDLTFEEAYEAFRAMCAAGEQAGADLCLIETMNDTYEIKAAVLAAKENTSLPIVVTMVFDEGGKLLTGADMEAAVAMLEGLRVDALGLNCGFGPDVMQKFLPRLREVTSLPIVVNPNAGLPVVVDGKTCFHVGPEEFAAVMKKIAEDGISVMGGCCGTTPAHIRALVEACRTVPPMELTDKGRSVVSSYTHAVVLDERPKIIGERINPTGKSRFKQALRDHNLEYILQEGVSQQDHGAHVLDVNVGLPEIDEPSMMEEVVKELQSIIDLPLQIDTSDLTAMERAMRVYNGKPLINSVNGKEESMRGVFPLVKKYGGVVVALVLDEDGIPDTAEGRLQVARKIYQTASEYGIGPEDIIIDALCMTISSDSQGAVTTLETVRRVREELGGKTILGVSNISFGLPVRENINGTFFAMALENGLSAAIINPNSDTMMRVYHSFRALMGLDDRCGDYIQAYAQEAARLKAKAEARKAGGAGKNNTDKSSADQTRSNFSKAIEQDSDISSPLAAGIERGLKDQSVRAVRELLAVREPMDLINQEMIPALDRVGKGFEAGTIFLPQLLMSAEAAKAAFELVRESLQASGGEQEKKGEIILATVKGDIHDIGKNIVKVLLENYGYEVLDLGKDVPPERIVDLAVERQVKLVGLSALMTTTVPSMEETIRLLRERAPWVKVMVGGAVLTKDYADSMGADQYCRDAMASVNYAEGIFAGER